MDYVKIAERNDKKLKCKRYYADMDKYAETKRRFQRGYRKRTGAGMYETRQWTMSEDELVLKQDIIDRELSKKIKRSVGAIQKRRWQLRKENAL